MANSETKPSAERGTAGVIGQPHDRVDGRAKVTGAAKYAGEFTAPHLAHGFVVPSAIAKGRVTSIDTKAALRLPGVLHVITHENRPKLPWFDRSYKDDDAPGGSPFRYLYDDHIAHAEQPIALVVAESFELARHAASLVGVTYEASPHATSLASERVHARKPSRLKLGFEPPPKPRGNATKAFESAAVRVRGDYTSPTEHHNPLEMHVSTVVYEHDGKLTIYDKTQGVLNSQKYVCNIFDLSTDDVRILSPFVGGAFGSGLRPQYNLYFAVMAALVLKRSVRVALTRRQMFSFGHRPETLQTVALAASKDGKLEAILHDAVAETSRFEDYVEVVVNWSELLYPCPNTALSYKVAPLDVYTPLDMRAPGAVLGLFALESAMDELSYAAGIDPVELRRLNYAARDESHDKPFSSKALLSCYEQGAARFGWSTRLATPRSMRDGNRLVGWGMATGIWDAMQLPAVARATLGIDGRLTVGSATADIGTGTYTVMSQIASEIVGIPMDLITFELGDSTLPMAPFQGGSATVASVGTAVKMVCEKLCETLLGLAAKMERSPFRKAAIEDVIFRASGLEMRDDPATRIGLREILRANDLLTLEEKATAVPNVPKQQKYARNTHSAVFVEVKVDEDLGTVEVTRVVSAIAAGRIINPKTARSQILGSVVWGVSMALHEETLTDHTYGRHMNHSLGEYHVAVQADVGDVDVLFVDEVDDVVNPLGAKGVGEIGILGVAAAVANAVFHATGVRVRSLPITLDKVMGSDAA